jgi:Ribonuclease G/E
MPGSLIVKKYKNQTVVVKVLDERFGYDGRRFTSLSAIAGEIPEALPHTETVVVTRKKLPTRRKPR